MINSGHLIWWLRKQLIATHDTYRFGFDWVEDPTSAHSGRDGYGGWG